MRGFDHATILSPSFHGLRKERLAQWPPFRVLNTTKNSWGYLQKNCVGVCGLLPETLTLFQTKICDFPHPISDLIKNLIPYSRPEALEPGAWPERVTSCYGTYTVVGVNIKREMVLLPNDEEVANSSKKHTQFKTRVHKPYPISGQNGRNWYPISDQNGWKKNIPFGAAHTHRAYIRDYPPGRKTRCRLYVSLLTQASASETNNHNQVIHMKHLKLHWSVTDEWNIETISASDYCGVEPPNLRISCLTRLLLRCYLLPCLRVEPNLVNIFQNLYTGVSCHFGHICVFQSDGENEEFT